MSLHASARRRVFWPLRVSGTFGRNKPPGGLHDVDHRDDGVGVRREESMPPIRAWTGTMGRTREFAAEPGSRPLVVYAWVTTGDLLVADADGCQQPGGIGNEGCDARRRAGGGW